MSPTPGLEVLSQEVAAAATVKVMPSKASRVPFEAVLSEKYLDITEPTSTRPLLHRPGGAQSLAFPAPEIQLQVSGILIRWRVDSCLSPASDPPVTYLPP